MARKHCTLIARKEIANSERFVVTLRLRPYSDDLVFFAGHRIPGSQEYEVRVYDATGWMEHWFHLTRTHGKFYIHDLKVLRNYDWRLVRKFYFELTRYRANDLCMALDDATSRSYITANEATQCLARQSPVPASHLAGLESAVAYAAAGGEGR